MKETFMKRYNFRNLYPKLVDCISLILFYPFLMFYYPKNFSIKKTDQVSIVINFQIATV